MEAKIKRAISETYSDYQLLGHNPQTFYDITLSIVSLLALSNMQQNNPLTATVRKQRSLFLFSEIADPFDKAKFLIALKAWEEYKGIAWKGALVIDEALMERTPGSYLRFMVIVWNRLWSDMEMDTVHFMQAVFEQLEEFMATGQKEDQMYIAPASITGLMAAYLRSDKQGTLYDPFARSGGLLAEAVQYLPAIKKVIGFSTAGLGWKLAKLRLLFAPNEFDLLMEEDHYPGSVKGEFDFIISNPPFGKMISRQRFDDISEEWSDLATKSNRLDVYYLCHILTRLSKTGKAAVLLPGIFLSGSSLIKQLIKRFVEHNILDTVISLPSGLFAYTGIATVMVGLNNDRTEGDKILLGDASSEADRSRRQAVLKTDKISEWLEFLRMPSAAVEDPLMALVSAEEIADKDFNLNVAMYRKPEAFVRTRVPSEKLKAEYEKLESRLLEARNELNGFLSKHLE